MGQTSLHLWSLFRFSHTILLLLPTLPHPAPSALIRAPPSLVLPFSFAVAAAAAAAAAADNDDDDGQSTTIVRHLVHGGSSMRQIITQWDVMDVQYPPKLSPSDKARRILDQVS